MQIELVGGPYCGHIIFPRTGDVMCIYGVELIGSRAPSLAEFLDDDLVEIDGPLGMSTHIQCAAGHWHHLAMGMPES